ncbi:hypothetical protein JR316_0004040 [Psilocybe cubensis]|uniref:Uncharacterized protein n=2 Tax=Psilocybe cubensis TaxID=181762 RepID=A0ACB8H9S3_PSICU|nr:hypothetical protein JR316_0004040 [Psilocybe cubensis]KAH9484558.1 hypothetical protein JR316_0004040 [Psilocybe cubensis]
MVRTDEDDATTSREVSEDEGDYPAATTNPYKSLLDDTSFARCHKTTIPRGKAETFTRAMLMLGHGTPIWENPKVGDKIGISIGDVGMLSSNGYFEYCFNIFQPPTHPLQLNCPKNLEQLSPYPEASDIATTSMYFPPGTALTSKGVEMERHSNLPLDITFTVKAREGAIMVLPNGASRQDLISTTHIRDYIRKHALEWYSFFNDPSSILCPNGSLYVITGVDTSDAWGVACWPHLHTDTGNVAKIRYKPTEKRSWQNVDQMACRSSGGTDSKMAGSTHFIRGIKIAVNESAWIRHVLCDTPPSAIPFYHVLTVPTTGLRAQVQTYLDKKLRDPEKRKAMPTHVLFHPLDIILRYILAEVPTTEVALVDEGLWSSVADQSDGTVANITRLLIKIIEQHEIELGDGWTSLRPRAPSNDSKDTRKATWPSILMGAPARMKDAWCDKARSRIISRKVRMLFPVYNCYQAREDGKMDASYVCVKSGRVVFHGAWIQSSGPYRVYGTQEDDDASGSRSTLEDGQHRIPDSTTNPYKSLMKDTSFARCHTTSIPKGKGQSFVRAFHMLGYGTPIWNNPQRGEKFGLSIGDVGVLNSEGYFEYCFNIFKPATDPMQMTCPPDMDPLCPCPEDTDITTIPMYFDPGTTLISKGVEMTRHSTSPLDISFTVKSREGAIMVLPNGASRQDLISTGHIRDYVRKHALAWYSFLNDPSCIVCPNGTLYVITGVDTSDAWGVACSSESYTDKGTVAQIRYKPTEDRSWQDIVRMACLSSGGSSTRKAGGALFIRGIKVAVNETAWNNHVLFNRIPSAIPFYDVLMAPATGFRAKLQSYIAHKLTGPRKQEDPHTQVPTVDAALIDESVWSSVADQSDGTVGPVTRLLIKIIESHELELGDGYATLKPRSPSDDTKKPREGAHYDILAHIKKTFTHKARSTEVSRKIRKLFPGTPLTYEQLHVNSLTSPLIWRTLELEGLQSYANVIKSGDTENVEENLLQPVFL